MRPSSAKAKGRNMQQLCRDMLLKAAPQLEQDDIRSNPMGAPGEDLLLSPAARKVYPFAFECKHVEKLNIWDAIEQAEENKGKHKPAVLFRKNLKDPHIVMKLSDFLELFYEPKQD